MILSWTNGSAKPDTSNGNGVYSFTVSYGFSGTLTPSKVSYKFTPTSISYTNVGTNQTNQNYTATAITYSISGNAGVAGAILKLNDGSTVITDTANGSGVYSFTVNDGTTDTVTPSLTGYTFSPTSNTYPNIISNQTNQNYTKTAITYTISGNAGVARAILDWTDGAVKNALADTNGNYTITVSYNWSGPVTPSKTSFSFNPANKTYSGILSNQLNQYYLASISNAPVAKPAINVTDTIFTASWSAVSGMLGYIMDVATDSNFTNILSKYNRLDVDTNLTYTITGLISGANYYYRVRAYYHNLISSNSNTIVVSTLLNAPTNLTAVYDSLRIQLKWNYNFTNSNVVGFIIFREGGPGTINKISIDTTNGNATTYIDKNVLEGYVYNYSVSAYNLSGIISAIGAAVTMPVLVPLKSPVNLSGIVLPGGKIELFWKKNSTTADGSIIERSAFDSTSFGVLTRTMTNDTTFTDSTGQGGLKYFYRVAAYRDTITSAYSNTISLVNVVTGTMNLLSGMPKQYQLYQNYPNPFNPSTQIRIALPLQSHVAITIYNILGSVVERLFDGELTAGYHEIQFNAGRLSSGVYIYRMTAGTYSKVLKLVLLK